MAIYLVRHPQKRQRHLPSRGFEPGSPRPQTNELDRSAMGPALIKKILTLQKMTYENPFCLKGLVNFV